MGSITAPVDDDPAGEPTNVGRPEGLEGFRRYTYWSLMSVAVGVLALIQASGPVPHPPDPVGIAAWLGVAVVAVAAGRLTQHHIPPYHVAPPSPRERRLWTVAGALASVPVAVSWLLVGDELFWAFAPGLIVALRVASLPRRARWVASVVTVLVAAGIGLAAMVVRDDGTLTAFPLGGAMIAAFVLFLTLATIWTWDVVVELDTSRRRAASLAVANERLRFAAELHDVQGHHLQVIALKSELAGRLVDTDPDAARREVGEVHELAGAALRDTRAVVQGYRRTTLSGEVANATSVLSSAGIDARRWVEADVEADLAALPEAQRHLLGLVVREAVTNVLRHSSATRADVEVARPDGLCLRVRNDGIGDAGIGDVGIGGVGDVGGLADLADRLRAAGGALSWGRDDGRFEVVATVPDPRDGRDARGRAW